MPRFALREFSRPDYRGSLPERDPNNAIWPRISAFAKMLHDISWEDDNDDYDDGTGRTEEERASDFERNASDNIKTSEDKKMDGYSEYLNKVHNDPQTDAELRSEGERQYRSDRDNDVNGGGRDRSGGMDRQRQLAEAAMREDPDTIARHRSELRDELNEVNENANIRTPAEDGGYYQMSPDYIKHYQEIIGTPADGIWGPNSRKAFKKFMDSQNWDDASL